MSNIFVETDEKIDYVNELKLYTDFDTLQFTNEPLIGRIKICQKMTEQTVPSRVSQTFYNVYDFMNKSLLFNHIMNIYKVHNDNNICIINYGFRDKKTNEILYCIANEVNEEYKWNMTDTLWTADTIKSQYNITHNTLPQMLRSDTQFMNELQSINTQLMECDDLISKTKWHNITIHKKRNNTEKSTLHLSISRFRNKIKQFHAYNMENIHLVPIINIHRNHEYRIEHIWMVRIAENVTIGIALQYYKQKMKVTGIHLDKDYLCKSHQLISTAHDCDCLDSFQTVYDDLIIGTTYVQKENSRLEIQSLLAFVELVAHTDESCHASLKQEANVILRCAQDSGAESKHIQTHNLNIKIQDLCLSGYESYTCTPANARTSNTTITIQKPSNVPQLHIDASLNAKFMPKKPFMSKSVKFTCSKRTIYIAKSLTDYYLLRTNVRFRDTHRMYYYLMQSIMMQIMDGFASMYNDTVAIVCCDLLDKVSSDALYVVIMRIRDSKQHRFKWKVESLSVFNEISAHYPYIQHSELPQSSRDTETYRLQLQQRDIIVNKIRKSMNNIKLRNKMQVKSKRQNRYKYNVDKEEIEMSEKQMRQCLIRSLRRKNPVAIIKINGQKYWIEWIVICQIKNRRLHFGVSFRYNSVCVKANNIFLDGVEIKKQNQLVNRMSFCDFDLNDFMSGISKINIV